MFNCSLYNCALHLLFYPLCVLSLLWLKICKFKTHDSVTYNPKSWLATPWTITQFSTYMWFHAACTTPDDFYYGDALHHQCPTCQTLTKSCLAFLRYKLQKIGTVSSFFSSFHKSIKVTIKWKWVIPLPWNLVHRKAVWYQVWLEYDKHSKSYLRLLTKITPICCNTHRVNCTWQEVERGKLTIEPQTFCVLK